jgi:two-component system, OmpR family, alkaline phosphatase synthesis response regulator PhoP
MSPRMVQGQKTRVLIVEDEPDIAALMKHALERGGDLNVEIVGTGAAALKAVMEDPPGLVLLDLNLPFIDGLEVCRLLRGRALSAAIPIIMVTARTGETDRVSGLELGADDYVTKPFSLRELVARVRAVLRRPPTIAETERRAGYKGGSIVIDFDAIVVTVSGAPVRLTKREFELLRFMVENRNRVLSRDRLLERVWGLDRQVETRSVDVHVGRLRGKLGPAGRQIETVIGMGYRFVESPEAAPTLD